MSAQKLQNSRAPFDDADADIIFRSSDGVDFRLYKVVLAKASPVFQGMFTLPDSQPPGEPQVVTMTEDANTLEGLLRFCYPVDRPPFRNLDILSSVIAAATKYDMVAVRTDILRREDSFLRSSSPMRVYILSCIWQIPSLARWAARELLNDPGCLAPDPMPLEFRTVPCEVMHAFAVYRKDRLTAALKIVDDDEWLISGGHSHNVSYSNKGNMILSSAWVWLACDACYPDDSREICSRKGATLLPRLWWSQYVAAVRRLLCERPTGAAATDPDIIRRALQGAARCRTCSEKARTHLTEFSGALTKRINKVVDAIELKLPFATQETRTKEVSPDGMELP